MRVADTAMRDWLQSVLVDYGDNFLNSGQNLRQHPLMVVRTSPERAFADMRKQLIAQGFLPQDDIRTTVPDDLLYKQTPMPICRFDLTDFRLDTTRSSTPSRIPLNVPGNLVREYRFPTPYVFSYTVEWLARTFFTMNYLQEWLMGQFTQVGSGLAMRKLTLTYPKPWGQDHGTLEFESSTDASEIEVEEGRDRLLRKTATFSLYVWDYDLVGLTPEVTGVTNTDGVTGVPMVYSPGYDAVSPSATDDVGFYQGTKYLSTTTGGRVLNAEPVSVVHTYPYTTGTRIRQGGTPGPIDISGAQVVELAPLPLSGSSLVQGRLNIRWFDVADPTATPGNLVVSVVSRDSRLDSPSASVLQSREVSPSSNAATIEWFTRPASSNYFPPGIRLSLPAGETRTYRVSLDRYSVAVHALPDSTEILPPLDTSSVTVFSNVVGKRNAFRADVVNPNGATVTVDVYANSADVSPVYSETFSATFREIVAVFNGLVAHGKVVVTNVSGDPSVQVSRMTVSALAQFPYPA